MPENRKYFPHNGVLLVTSRTEEGIPMVPTYVMNFIIWGILARGRNMYRVKICHFCFMGNHFHMLLVVDDPQHVSDFIGYVKCEISHAVNRLLGRRRKIIWLEGYDSPLLLTSTDVMKYIRYIYLNPTRANLVESIKNYPGVSSWKMFVEGEDKKKCKKLYRTSIKRRYSPALSIKEQKEIIKVFEAGEFPEYEFVLEPIAWMNCFEEYRFKTPEQIKTQLLTEIENEEQELSKRRNERDKGVIGATELRRQSIDKEYQPKTFAKKMICLCQDVGLREAFIDRYRAICEKARRVYKLWKLGDLIPKIPPGLFAPRVPMLISEISI